MKNNNPMLFHERTFHYLFGIPTLDELSGGLRPSRVTLFLYKDPAILQILHHRISESLIGQLQPRDIVYNLVPFSSSALESMRVFRLQVDLYSQAGISYHRTSKKLKVDWGMEDTAEVIVKIDSIRMGVLLEVVKNQFGPCRNFFL